MFLVVICKENLQAVFKCFQIFQVVDQVLNHLIEVLAVLIPPSFPLFLQVRTCIHQYRSRVLDKLDQMLNFWKRKKLKIPPRLQ